MQALGIICEYNPFHLGHAYHIATAREMSGCDAVVCAMSGSVVQRGEIALTDKWTRARHALQNGADLVVELPSYYVLQSADVFAHGGVSILQSLGVQYLSFGSETGDLPYLESLAAHMQNESERSRATLTTALAQGLGDPAAYARALAETDETFATPPGANDLLGAAYLGALHGLGGTMTPIVVRRRGATHDQSGAQDGFASASEIRARIYDGKPVEELVPWQENISARDASLLDSHILAFFRNTSPEHLARVPGMEQGLENRLICAARESGTAAQFLEKAVTRRYTASRVRRAVLCALLDIRCAMEPDGIRVLGFTPTGVKLLHEAKKTCPLPLVVKMADFTPSQNGMMAVDIRATDLAALCDRQVERRCAGADYTTSPVRVGF